MFVAPEPPPPPPKLATVVVKGAGSPPQAATKGAVASGDYPDLALKAISPGVRTLANINGIIIAEGQTITVPLKAKSVKVKCVKINRDSVEVIVEGEVASRQLRMH